MNELNVVFQFYMTIHVLSACTEAERNWDENYQLTEILLK